jgi:cephalosporin-C deacetylase-like acetyl esterase
MRADVEFPSQGECCRGWLLTPDDGEAPYPTVVMAGGWCYVKEIVMPHYAEYFVRGGFAVLVFDYRGFGGSDGARRQHIDPWLQVEDYRNAITFAESLPQVDPAQIAVWGISYSGGHVLIVGALDPRVRCIVSNIPVVDGWATMRRVHGERRFGELLDRLLDDRRRRFAGGDRGGTIPMAAPDPARTLATWPFPDVYETFQRIKEAEAPLHEHWSTLESTELLLAYTVFPFAARILNTPTLMVVAEGDDITLWDLEIAAYNTVTTPRKRLVVLPDVSHMSLYSQRSNLEIAATEAVTWMTTHLASAAANDPVSHIDRKAGT